MPVAIGATTPDPGRLGVAIWSTLANQQLVWDGQQWAIQGDVVAQVMPLVGFTEVVRTNGRITSVILWSDAQKTRKVSETLVTRGASSWIASTTKRRFDAEGGVAQAATATVSRDAGGQVQGVRVVKA